MMRKIRNSIMNGLRQIASRHLRAETALARTIAEVTQRLGFSIGRGSGRWLGEGFGDGGGGTLDFVAGLAGAVAEIADFF